MRKQLQRFIINLLIFTIIFAIPGILFSVYAPDHYVTPALPYLYFLFFGISLLTYYLISSSLEKKISRFVNIYMISTFIRLVLFAIIIVIYVFLNKQDAIPFIITFFIFYLFYTSFEVISILKISGNR